MTAVISLIGALAALVTAIGALVGQWRGHQVVNGEVKPQVKATAQAVTRLADDAASTPAVAAEVKQIVNGAAR